MIARNEWINSSPDGMKAFNPYSKEDHGQLFRRLEQEGYLTLQFSHQAIAVINDRYRQISVRLPNSFDENKPLAKGYRIRPVVHGIEDRVTGKVTHYSAHMVPENAGDIELFLEEKGKTYECYVFTEAVVAYDVSMSKPQQVLPRSWQRQTLATKIRDSLERLSQKREK